SSIHSSTEMGQRLLFTVILLAYGRNVADAEEKMNPLLEKSMEYVPNTVMYAALQDQGLDTKVPTYFAACVNGVLCEAADTSIDDNLKTNVFAGAVTDAQREELKFAFRSCSPAPTNPNLFEKCNCDKTYTPPYCLTQYIKEVNLTGKTPKECAKPALEKLKKAGWQVLGQAYDLDKLKDGKGMDELKKLVADDASTVDGFTQIADATKSVEAGKFFCDALNPEVEKAVEILMSSDYSFMKADDIVASLLFEDVDADQFQRACKEEPDFYNHDFGKCMCSMTKGSMFCVYKALGQFFLDENFLKCPTPPTPAAPVAPTAEKPAFDKTKKPAKIPKEKIVPPKPKASKGGSSSSSSSTPAPASSAADLLSLLPLALPALLLAH
ncbi:hypothetical protein PFISCL1PPCAC_11221, partial [Pristionchus fissidentatus]